MEKKIGRLEERHILGTLTNPGDPHHPLHDDNDYDGNNDEENQQQLLHLVGDKMGDEEWRTISVGRGNILDSQLPYLIYICLIDIRSKPEANPKNN